MTLSPGRDRAPPPNLSILRLQVLVQSHSFFWKEKQPNGLGRYRMGGSLSVPIANGNGGK